MAYETLLQSGTEDKIPEPVVELQQLALAMLLIWDGLDEHYASQILVENLILHDWAVKNDVPRAQAFEVLQLVKSRLVENPWFFAGLSQDFKNQSWMTVLLFRPKSNQDVIEQISAALRVKPFKDEQHHTEEKE